MNPLRRRSLGSSSMSLLVRRHRVRSRREQRGVGGMTTVGTATAIGNSLNVVTVGNNNTVIVNSRQVNNGNQTATVNQTGGQQLNQRKREPLP